MDWHSNFLCKKNSLSFVGRFEQSFIFDFHHYQPFLYMKTSFHFLKHMAGVLLLAGILFSCDENREKTRTEKALEQTGDAIQEDSKDLANKLEQKTDSVGEELDESKDVFVARMKEKSREVDAEINELQAKMERQGRKADQNLKEEMANLRAKRDEMNRDLEKVQKSTGNAWRDLKAGIRRAADELDKGFSDAKDNFEKDSVR